MGWPLDYDSGLVPDGFWLMNEGSGNRIQDLSGNNRDGLATGTTSEITWTTGEEGKVISFAGDAQARFAFSTITFAATDQWTIIFKCKKGTDDALEGIIIGENFTTANYIYLNEGTRFRFRNSVPASLNFAKSDFTYWQTYALLAKGDNNVTLYVDGLFNETVAGASSFVIDNIGDAYNHASYPFAGEIEYVYIYKCALSASEIAQIFQEPFCMFKDPAELLLNYPWAPTGVAPTGVLSGSLVGCLGGPI